MDEDGWEYKGPTKYHGKAADKWVRAFTEQVRRRVPLPGTVACSCLRCSHRGSARSAPVQGKTRLATLAVQDKTNTYTFLFDAKTQQPLQLHIMGYNILGASHYDGGFAP
jgi:hypothetical protein